MHATVPASVPPTCARQGIDSISLIPDRVVQSTRLVARIETEAGNGG